jgi:fatty acid amide hydrolase
MPAPDTAEGVRLFLRAVSAGGGTDYFELLGDEKPIPQVAGLLRGVKLPAPMRPILSGMMKGRGQQFLSDQIRHLQRSSAGDYQAIVEARNAYRAVFTAGLDGGRFDAVICPPIALPAFTHGSSEHLFPAVSYAFIYNVLGAPAGVVPTTRVRPGEEGPRTAGKDMAEITAARVEKGSAGLPVGVQVVARHWDDHVVLAVMGALEEHFRQTPDYPDPADLMR